VRALGQTSWGRTQRGLSLLHCVKHRGEGSAEGQAPNAGQGNTP